MMPGLFGGELQPAGGDQAQPSGQFAHHGGQGGMAQSLLHDRQNGFAGFRENDAIRLQPGGGEGGGKQVRSLQDPQHRSVQARQNAGGEQGRGGGVLGVGPGGGGFMQRPQAQAAGGKCLIDRRNADGDGFRRAVPAMGMLDAGDAFAQFKQYGGGPVQARRIDVGRMADGVKIDRL